MVQGTGPPAGPARLTENEWDDYCVEFVLRRGGSKARPSREVQHEEDVPAQQASPEAHARFPGSHAQQQRAARAEAAATEGSQAARGLSGTDEPWAMARFRSRQRLRTRAEFDRVFRRGVRQDGRLFVLIAAPSAGLEDRLGLTVSRRVGAAVTRNRVRRLLRESFRSLRREAGPAVDLVVLAKPELAGRGFEEVQRELHERLRALTSSPRLGRAGRARAD